MIAADDVEAVLIRGEAVYGEKDFLTAFTGDESLAAYGQYTAEDGDSKYFRVPKMFGEKTLQEIYSDYEAVLSGAEISMSRVRETEDPQYDATLDDLKNTLKQQE